MNGTATVLPAKPLVFQTITEAYCHYRNQDMLPEQAYRMAKGLNPLSKVSARTLRYQESNYKKIAFDARKLPEMQIAAARTYSRILSGQARKSEKVSRGEVVEYKEKPSFSVMADLAKDTLEHNNPTIKRSESLILKADISPVDMGKYRNKSKHDEAKV